MLASDCNPQWHSLPALIAEYYRVLNDYADITLVTQIRNKVNLDAWLPPEAKVVYLDTERIAGPLYRLSQKLTRDANKAMTLQVALSYPSHIYFERAVWRKFKARLTAGDFDIVHRASPMSPTIPSPLAKLSPVPFIVGPLLGGLPWPKAFKGDMRREGEWMNYFRALHRYLPHYKNTYKYAAAIMAGYKHTVTDIPDFAKTRVIEFSEGGIHPSDFPVIEKPKNVRAKILFVGRLVPFKQPEVLIRCFERSALLKQHQLIIVGDGPELPRLKSLVETLGLQSCVELVGTLAQARVREVMHEADIFAFPSIREQGGGVLTMASMSRTPCVVVDYGGPSARVPEGCGIKIPLGSKEQITQNFVKALENLINNREQVEVLGNAARKFTEQYYSWAWKAQKTLEIYHWVLGWVPNKPDFWSKTIQRPEAQTGVVDFADTDSVKII